MLNIMSSILIIAVGRKMKNVAKSLKKNSKLCMPKENSTDETDSEIKHHGKEQMPSSDVQQKSLKSLTKTIHWNRIKRTSPKTEHKGILLL